MKTSLKLLLVFVEYTESNATLLIKAVDVVDGKRGETSAPSAGVSVSCGTGAGLVHAPHRLLEHVTITSHLMGTPIGRFLWASV